MHKATANGGDNKCMHIYEVLKAVGFGNMRPGAAKVMQSADCCQRAAHYSRPSLSAPSCSGTQRPWLHLS